MRTRTLAALLSGALLLAGTSHAAAQVVIMKADDDLQLAMDNAVFYAQADLGGQFPINIFFEHSGADPAEIALLNYDQYLAPISRNLSEALLPPIGGIPQDFGYHYILGLDTT